MAKTLCKRIRQLKDDLPGFAEKVGQPRFICAKCGRAAKKKKHLCEPKRLSAPSGERPHPTDGDSRP